MKRQTVLWLVILFAALPLFAGNDVWEKKDTPMQTTYFIPKFKGVSEGGMWSGTAHWAIYPLVSQTFKHDRKSMQLVVSVFAPLDNMKKMLVGNDGGGKVFAPSTLTFLIDGEKVEREINPTEISYKQEMRDREWRVELKQTPENDELIKRIAAAKEVWITLSGGDAVALSNTDRRSAHFTADKLTHFSRMIEFYQGTEPKL